MPWNSTSSFETLSGRQIGYVDQVLDIVISSAQGDFPAVAPTFNSIKLMRNTLSRLAYNDCYSATGTSKQRVFVFAFEASLVCDIENE